MGKFERVAPKTDVKKIIEKHTELSVTAIIEEKDVLYDLDVIDIAHSDFACLCKSTR